MSEDPSTPGKVLQIGATGDLGGRIARRLLDRDVDLRILVRGGSTYEHLAERGAEPVHGDLRDPDSLADAVEGVERVVTTANAPGGREHDTIEAVDLHGDVNVVEAAEDAGVEQLVYTSAWLAEEDDRPSVPAQGGARVAVSGKARKEPEEGMGGHPHDDGGRHRVPSAQRHPGAGGQGA